jgi:hypothetical protein
MSGTITQIWAKSKKTFESKNLSQILGFAGDGKLRDGNPTSKELREFLGQVPSRLLKNFSNDCLSLKFNESGFALQDIINQVGIRLGFSVEQGLYRGKTNDIGYDGIWHSEEKHSIVIEVKTTDTFRMNLDIIAGYRNRLIDQKRIDPEKSSILIIVGRDDTGDLEAQIRGSKHAWDIRLISIDTLINLLVLKETLNDTRTIRQINQLLKPNEYTRIDKLIDLIFLASKDIQLETSTNEEIGILSEKSEKEGPKFIPSSFHEECVVKIKNHLKVNLIKQSRISYANEDKSLGLICSISKIHDPGKNENYWFSLYPHQSEYLNEFPEAYVAYGCGSAETVVLIPFSEFKPMIKYFLKTENEERMYYHVAILKRENKLLMQHPKNPKQTTIDITKYKM